MNMRLTYLGHSAFKIETAAGQSLLIDPYLDGNALAPLKSSDLKADYILLTHAHGDHIGDAFKIADPESTLFICVSELARYIGSRGFKAHAMHIGGAHDFPFGRVKLTIAHHGSLTLDGQYGGPAAGIVLTVDEKTIYHCGDTGLFLDMQLIGERDPIDIMLVPIGDNFTMGIPDAVKAVELVRPQLAIPMHYNTFPLIKADPEDFSRRCASLGFACRVLKPGEAL